jgi:hypothetical protein
MSRHSTALWWDNECPILNSRTVHTFDCSPDTSPLSALGLDPTQPHFAFFLIKSDLDGNLPVSVTSSKAMARVYLPMPVLLTALSRANFRQRVTLDILRGDHDSPELQEDGKEYCGKLTLLLNHRVVPPGARGGRVSTSLEKLLQRPEVGPGAAAESASGGVNAEEGTAQLSVHLDKILHLTDEPPTLRGTHEIFLFCSVTTPQVSFPPILSLSDLSTDASYRESLSLHHSNSPH